MLFNFMPTIYYHVLFFFFFKQKTAYEMRISDWSSDVCSSDLMALGIGQGDEVATPGFTYIATAEAAAVLGAKPVYVDIDPITYNLNPALIEAAKIGRASCRERVCQYV